MEKLALGKKRALLTLATGAGKTFIAVHLLKRIADAGQLDAINRLPAALLREAFSGRL